MTVSVRPPTNSRTTTGGVLGRAFLAVVLAFLFWAWVTNGDDPDRRRDFANVRVAATGVSSDLSITSMTPANVSLSVWGPRSVATTATLSADSFKLIVDLQNAKPGTQNYPVHVVDAVKGLRKRQVTPDTVQVTLERTIQKSIPVTVQTAMQTGIQVRSTTANPAQVTIHGPESRVNAVTQVVASLDLGDHITSFATTIDAKAVDANGATVPDITFDNSRVLVQADIADLGNERAVFVNANVMGSPASGFQNTDVVVTPAQITLVGDQQRIRAVPNVSTEPINIDGFRQTTTLNVPLARLPDGVTIKGGVTSVTVQVVITERTQDEKFSVPITYVNCRAGLHCTSPTTDTTVTLRGTRQQLDDIRNRVTVQADFSPFVAPVSGPQNVDLTVLLPSDTKVVVVDNKPSPATILASIAAVPTVTPVPPTSVPPTSVPLPTATPVPPPTPTRPPPPTATLVPPTATAAP